MSRIPSCIKHKYVYHNVSKDYSIQNDKLFVCNIAMINLFSFYEKTSVLSILICLFTHLFICLFLHVYLDAY
jgi:hypothetical protein